MAGRPAHLAGSACMDRSAARTGASESQLEAGRRGGGREGKKGRPRGERGPGETRRRGENREVTGEREGANGRDGAQVRKGELLVQPLDVLWCLRWRVDLRTLFPVEQQLCAGLFACICPSRLPSLQNNPSRLDTLQSLCVCDCRLCCTFMHEVSTRTHTCTHAGRETWCSTGRMMDWWGGRGAVCCGFVLRLTVECHGVCVCVCVV